MMLNKIIHGHSVAHESKLIGIDVAIEIKGLGLHKYVCTGRNKKKLECRLLR